MMDIIEEINAYNIPILATAIHNGHAIRPDVSKYLEIDAFSRLREEDPYTEVLAEAAGNRIVSMVSRFEVDLNRSRDEAIYRTPEQSWGLKVWKDHVPVEVWEKSLEAYDGFYRQLDHTVKQIIKKAGFIIVYDIHTYNYRREEALGRVSDPKMNPDINVGTGTLDRRQWGSVVDTFIQKMKAFEYSGRKLSVAENIRFKGGYMGKWIHEHYPGQSCVLSIEFKKIFMDEWTGAVDLNLLFELKAALAATINPVLQAADNIKARVI